jgi:hypothetical protein
MFKVGDCQEKPGYLTIYSVAMSDDLRWLYPQMLREEAAFLSSLMSTS